MDDRRFAKVREIFDAVAALPPAERAGAIEERCAGDAELAAEVRSLLDADSASESMFGWSPAEHALAAEEDASRAGEKVGEYTLVRRLGAGGMGEVWLAEHQIDDAVRHVALKFIRPGLDTESVVRRFRHERRVLAGMEHPCIARLFDGGATCDGRPYLVMEYVEGAPIDTYCAENNLGINERLALFARVCDAVHFAHQSLVVHRDLKPENILVSVRGDPKLLDFGIARVLTPDADQSLTLTGQRVFTPKYASPEQIRGESVTTATDVYSLGVILYRLLAGCGPFDDAGGDKALETAICEREPTRPSAAATTHAGELSRLRRRLSGDLDTIVLMAMRKEPERRYASAEQLADDVRRHLAGMPVRARPDTLGYRTRKFASRHAVSVSGLAAAFVALLVGVIVFGYLFRDASLARAAERVAKEDAQSRAAEAEQTSAFFAQMLGSVAPDSAKGRDMTVLREVLDRASGRVTSELAEYPQAEATLRLTIGNTYRLLGDYERAGPHLDAALELSTNLHGADSLEVAEVWHKQAILAEALGEYDRAAALLDRQLAVREPAGDRVGIAEVWMGQARLASVAGEIPAMIGLAEQARDVFNAEFGERDARTLKAIVIVAGGYIQTRRFEEAEREMTRVVELWTEVEGPLFPDTIVSEANLAMLLRQLGRHDVAELRLASVVERASQVFGDEHELTLRSRLSYAQTLMFLGRFEDAESHARAALETLQGTLGEAHPQTLHAMSVLGSGLKGAGRLDEAIPLLRESLRLHTESMGPDSPGTNATANLLASTLIDAGPEHYEEAERLLIDAIDRLEALAGPDFPLTRNAVNRLRVLYGPDTMDQPEKLAELNERFGEG